MDTHPSNQLGRHSFRIDHGFIGGHVQMEVPLVDASERTEVRAERCTGSLAGVAVHLAAAIPIIISCPLAHAVADGGVGRMAASVALPFVRVEDRAVPGEILSNQARAGVLIRTVTDPKALLARLARDNADDGGAVVRVGTMPPALIGAPTGWIGGIAMGCSFFPPRSGRVHRPQRPYRS
jgi:hypothetical protein